MKIKKNVDEETLLVAEDDVIKVEFLNIGEGYNGDYNPQDPDDEPLIRFDVSICEDGQWREVDDASYCTKLKVSEKLDVLEEKITAVFNRYRDVVDHILAGGSVKKLGEELSWI